MPSNMAVSIPEVPLSQLNFNDYIDVFRIIHNYVHQVKLDIGTSQVQEQVGYSILKMHAAAGVINQTPTIYKFSEVYKC